MLNAGRENVKIQMQVRFVRENGFKKLDYFHLLSSLPGVSRQSYSSLSDLSEFSGIGNIINIYKCFW